MQALIILLLGFACGFCSSAPLGPINMWVVEQTLNRTSVKRKLLPFTAGVVGIDIAFALLALWGYAQLLHNTINTAILGLIGASFLLLIGLLMLRPLLFPATPLVPALTTPPIILKRLGMGRGADFLMGVFLCASNPAFLLFWIYAVKQMDAIFAITPSLGNNLLFAGGVLGGDFLWFHTLVLLVKKSQLKLGSSLIAKIRFGIAIAFMILGCVGLWQNY